MADGRHFENRYIAISQWRIIRFWLNFVHSGRFWTGWMSRDRKWKSCIGQTPSSTERISCFKNKTIYWWKTEIVIFSYHTAGFNAPVRIVITFGTEKVEWWIYQTVKSMRVRSLVLIQCTNVTDRQTDGQTPYDGVGRSVRSVARQKPRIAAGTISLDSLWPPAVCQCNFGYCVWHGTSLSVILSRAAARRPPITPLSSLFHLNSIRNEFLDFWWCWPTSVVVTAVRWGGVVETGLLRHGDQGWQ